MWLLSDYNRPAPGENYMYRNPFKQSVEFEQGVMGS
jgi:hypothetical protein